MSETSGMSTPEVGASTGRDEDLPAGPERRGDEMDGAVTGEEIGVTTSAASDATGSGDGSDVESEADGDGDEGDVAADYLEELLDICDLDGDLDIDVRDERVYLTVSSEEPGALRMLSDPDTVQALQELTRLAVQSETGEFSRLILDVGGSRDARRAQLATLVDRAVARLEEGSASASLPAMSSYERKLVHDLVAERGFASESEGEGAGRHTVITRA